MELPLKTLAVIKRHALLCRLEVSSNNFANRAQCVANMALLAFPMRPEVLDLLLDEGVECRIGSSRATHDHGMRLAR